MARPGQSVEAHPSFRYTVRIDNVNHAAFTECTLPSLQVETQDLNEGGQNEYAHKLPVRVKPGTIKLRQGITRDGELLIWYFQVLKGELKKALRPVTITIHDAALKPVMTFALQGAYPVRYNGPSLKAGDQALAIEELELAYHAFEVQLHGK
jgi:phage tail-like protein